jgi:hypothetical protein
MPSRPAPGLIHDVYPLSSPGDFSYLFGGYGSAKTHYELRKLFNIATGTDFFGNKTIKGLCVFYAAENPESVRRRFYCLIRHFKIKNPEEIPLLIIKVSNRAISK